MILRNLAGLFALGGVLLAAPGCGETIGDETETPSETPTEYPVAALDFDHTTDAIVSCTGDTWAFDLIVDGWTADDPKPLLGIYDNADYAYCADDISGCYAEPTHTLTSTGFWEDPYYETLALELAVITDLASQVDGVSTIVGCGEIDAATFSFCAFDHNNPGNAEQCYFWGDHATEWAAEMGQ